MRCGIAPTAVSQSGRERSVAGKKAEVAQAAAATEADTAAHLIDAKIAALGDWRGATLSRVRQIIRAADPDVIEEIKWRKPTNPAGVPVWSHAGIVCTGEIYKDKVKLTFAKGALLDDPSGLFNSSLDGNIRRAIDIFENAHVDEAALTLLIRSAVALNSDGR
jgi:hypothetical protein